MTFYTLYLIKILRNPMNLIEFLQLFLKTECPFKSLKVFQSFQNNR